MHYRYLQGMSQKRKRHGAAMEFDSTPVADLSFNLLIFFIVTASFILRQGIFLSLPSASAGSIRVEEKQIVEIVPTDSAFVVDGAEITRPVLLDIMKKRRLSNQDTIALIRMAPEVKYDRLVDTLSAVREAGLVKISLKNTGEE